MLEQNGNFVCGTLNGLSAAKAEYLNGNAIRTFSSREVEMLRLIGQYLCDKGFNGTYTQLSKESGIALEHSDATELRHAILEGRWSDAEAAINKLAPMIGDSDSVDEVRFLILEQRFLEYLEANDVMPAVTLLRNRITPMQRNTERVHTLASCLMCSTITELRAQAGGWAGVDAGSRLQLINRIQAFIPPHTMLPPHRLEELINESVRAQLASCIFHNPPLGAPSNLDTISLLQRHSCGMQDFPAFCIQTLDQRDSDLWFCQFSPDGTYLATGGKEANVDVWRVDPIRHAVSFFRVLNTPAYVGCLCWSPDSKRLAACCGEDQSSVVVFDVFTGQQLCSQKVNDEDTYSTAAFFADSRKLAFGGLKGSFYVMDTEDQGRILTIVEGYRVQSMAAILPPIPSVLLPDGTESVQVNRTPPGAPDSAPNGFRVDANSDVNGQATSQIDQLLIADSLHRIRLFRFGPLGPSNSQAVGTTDATEIATTATLTESSTSTTSTSTTSVSTISVATPTQTNPSVVAGGDVSSVSALSAATSALAVYLSSGSVPGAPGLVNISTSGSSTTSETTTSGNNSGSGEPAAVAAALTVARLAQQQQQRLLQSNTTTSPASTAGILLDMPILPASLPRLSSHSQSIQTHPGLQPLLHQSAPLHGGGGSPYTVVSSTGGSGNFGSGGSSLTILFGAPLERSTSASYSSTSSTGTTTATTTTGVRALTAAAAALAGSHSRSFAGFVHSLSTANVSTASSPVESGTGTRTASTAEVSVGTMVSTASTATSTATGLGSTSNVGGISSTASAVSSSGFGTIANAGSGQVANSSHYGLLDHRTLFKETHPVQSVTVSRSGTRALITVHKMGLHLWDLKACAITQRFIGHKQDTFRLHSTFGGATEDFVATGSENGRIHIWHASSGSHPIHTSPANGNRDPITCVHWNPVLPTMIASVNDAGELCIWGPQRYVIGSGQPMDSSS